MNTEEQIRIRRANDTLNGGRIVRVQLVPLPAGEVQSQEFSAEDVFVKQVRRGKYMELFPLAYDEIQVVAKICDKPLDWMDRLTPESYEVLQAAAWEVNERGFFSFAERQRKKNQAALQDAPAELLEQIARQAVAQVKEKSTSPITSPR